MILIGQYDPPFVRRVVIAMRLYGLAFEHRPWSTLGDAAQLVQVNPHIRVPTLILDDGEALMDSGSILNHLNETVGGRHALIARSGPARRAALKISALPTVWIDLCHAQITATLQAFEGDRTQCVGTYWFGENISHADIATICALRFAREVHPDLFNAAHKSALARHAAYCEALSAFQDVVQPLAPAT
ncbi:MAG: glutathione S-transferase family protein [Acetobacteraceae bacterium]|nr:glutathione S-transferase family protein [Acetobacteraceae bacterium]MSP30056.1 glutathione S-transferase family protein [Acetobacteraceae bacterium]